MSESATTSGSNESGMQQTTHRASTEGIDLLPDERALVNAHPGWSLWWKQLGAAAVVILLGLSTAEASGIITGLVVGGVIIGYTYLSRIQSQYIVTSERVKGKVGILSKSSREYRISDLESITTEQSIMERVLGHGHIRFRTSANDQMVWHGVEDYENVGRQIRKRRREYDSTAGPSN